MVTVLTFAAKCMLGVLRTSLVIVPSSIVEIAEALALAGSRLVDLV